MKKIALLTIHKILNYGSSLQTYAFCKYIENKYPSLDCEIIDYKFANSWHFEQRRKELSRYRKIHQLLHRLKMKFSKQQQILKRLFREFWTNEYRLSMSYNSPSDIIETPPKGYCLYIIGSDQVWNTKTVCGDPVFLLSFVSDRTPRVSYASSFGRDSLDERYYSCFRKYLAKFDAISVRENTAVEIVNYLNIGKKAMLVCDPTLLLDSTDYEKLSKNSTLVIKEDYLLVYCLSYSFDPELALKIAIGSIIKENNIKIVFLGNHIAGYEEREIKIPPVGPYEFVYLFKNAKFVVTSSFHGTAFSVINRKPFISISPDKGDTRIKDFLCLVSLQKHIMYLETKTLDGIDPYSYDEEFNAAFSDYIMKSKDYIDNFIKMVPVC